MKKIFCLLTLASLGSAFSAFGAEGFYALQAQSIDGKPTPLSNYAGKLTLVVNTASECGYTPQYKGLESLYEKYKDKGLVVLGFPSNDFGAQEPGSDAEIKKFCTKKFKVSFPMFSKGSVSGAQKQPTYKYLVEKAPVSGEVSWNFEKFLVNPKGEVVARYKSGVTPLDSQLEKDVVRFLPK